MVHHNQGKKKKKKKRVEMQSFGIGYTGGDGKDLAHIILVCTQTNSLVIVPHTLCSY